MAHEDSQTPFLTRRGLIITAITGVVGCSLTTLCEEYAGAQGSAPSVADYMFDFARQVGFARSPLNIHDYKGILHEDVQTQVDAANTKMYRGNFIYIDTASVWRADNDFFYTAIHRDRFNACAAFFDKQTGIRTMMEGPTLVGLSLASRYLKGLKHYDSSDSHDLLYPQKAVSLSAGTFQKGYQQPDIYRSENGIVRVGYTNLSHDEDTKKGKGRINVIGIEDHEGDRKVVLNQDFSVSYQYT